MGTPNAIAYAALLIWPLVALMLFRRLGPVRGMIATFLGGHLLLPTLPAEFDLPILPSLDKNTIPSFTALAIAVLLYRPHFRFWPEHSVARLLVAVYLFAPLLTILANADPINWGPLWLPGMKLSEAPSIILGQLARLTPFLLARAFLAAEDKHRDLLRALVIGGLAYSLPMLLEVRISPQLNIWIYGYFQHSFAQMMRGDGFRPIVFLNHGLWAALLVSTVILATCTLLRTRREKTSTLRLMLTLIWLLGVLVACKSLASLLYALAIGPVILAATTRMQVRLAALLGLLAFAYPVMRGTDLIPVDQMVKLAAEGANAERAQSLEYRFDNERVLLDRVMERPFFGWGGWGRNHVYDSETGRVLTVTDGRWIVVMGGLGWTGYCAEFGLLILPLLLIWWRGGAALSRLAAGQALILAVNVVDMIPNDSLTSLTWILAGALLGWVERPQAAAFSTQATVLETSPMLPVLIGGTRRRPDLRPLI